MARNALTVLAAVLTSCCACLAISWVTQPRTGVAIVDLDEVSKQLGRRTTMQQSLQEKTQQTQQKLAAIEQNAVSQLEEARRALGKTPTPEQAQKWQKMQQSASLQLNQLKQKAEQELSGHRQQLVAQFREQARPIAARIAKEHGFSTVMTRNDTFVFSYEQTVDITDEVAKAMAALPATASTPATKPVSSAPAKAPVAPAKATTAAAKPVIQQVNHETR